MYDDDELRAELEEEGTSPEEIQQYFDLKNMTEKDFESLKYLSNRDAIMQDMPGYVGSIAGALPVAAGPLGAVGQGANLISKGNRLSQTINKLRKIKGAKALDAGVGIGVIPGSLEALGREVIPSVTDKFE
jgi:hypothetical protein